MIFIATGSRRFWQMAPVTPLQANASPVAGSVGIVLDWLKSPARSSAVGTTALFRNVLVVCRRPEYDAKKKVRSWTIGPPAVAPNWLRLSGGGAAVDPQSLALSVPSRKYSNADPWAALVPLLVTTLMTPFEKRPY